MANLGILGFFKYFNFFIETTRGFSLWLGLPISVSSLEIFLPLGISFYTFQTLSYSIDVYRGRMHASESFLDVSLFVAFFPQLVAGPIVRASEFIPQLKQRHRLGDVDFRAHLTLFLVGYFKKSCVADNVAAVIDPVFASPAAYGIASKWLASLLYTLQIYCDFSGYSDMAIASAGLLGFRLTLNFDFPYIARSIRSFWRRWHISLSSWFRDYLYIPLGGNRAGGVRTGLNLFIVFLLCGLWHGASWNFVLWGAFHGAFLSLERRAPVDRLPGPIGWLYTLLVVNTGFIIFRTQDLASAFDFIVSLVGFSRQSGASEIEAIWWLALVGFGLAHAACSRRSPMEWVAVLPSWAFGLLYGAAVALVLPWAARGYKPFIYFQF